MALLLAYHIAAPALNMTPQYISLSAQAALILICQVPITAQS